MSVELLDKIRKVNKLLHNNTQSKVVFSDICEIVGECLNSNMLVLSVKGKVLGSCMREEITPLPSLLSHTVGERIDAALLSRLEDILSTNENISLETLGFDPEDAEKYCAFVSPVEIAGERFGTVFLYRDNKKYEIDDIILCEYATTVIGLEMVRSESEEFLTEQRKQHDVKSAMSSLSISEAEAVIQVIDELNGEEGIIIASKIADRSGITRSVIVNAIRKLESADVIMSRSSGMKGTYIRVLNEYLFDEVENLVRNKRR